MRQDRRLVHVGQPASARRRQVLEIPGGRQLKCTAETTRCLYLDTFAFHSISI